MKLPLISFTVIILLSSLSCNTTEPFDDIKPGRRDYVWTVDTLDTPNIMSTIWGSSPDNVWAGGYGGLDSYNRLWHFNGTEWKSYGKIIPTDPKTIFGFSETDIWLGGDEGRIFHYDGQSWKLSFVYEKMNSSLRLITDIGGTATNNVYAVGVVDIEETQRGFILHFDGVSWKEIYYSDNYSQYSRIMTEGNNVFIRDIKLNLAGTDTLLFSLLKDSSVTEFYRTTEYATMNEIGDQLYFLIDNDLYTFKNNSLNKIMTFQIADLVYSFSGRNEKDIFIGLRNGIVHFNGVDYEKLITFDNEYTDALNPIILTEDIFFSAYDFANNLNLMIHGKLNN